MTRPFTFKEFTIFQENAAMKVGTDSVLLGSWVKAMKAERILDIGCGTALLSLMMAQRFPHAQISGIEIESGAIEDAKANILKSPWPERIKLINHDFLSYSFDSQFDLIISNPPFFPKDTQAPIENRAIARSGVAHSFLDWLRKSKELLQEKGSIAFIFPVTQWNELKSSLGELGLHVIHIAYVRPKETKAIHRVMVQLSKQEQYNINEEFLFIEKEKRHDYSDEYRKLTAAFYLDKS